MTPETKASKTRLNAKLERKKARNRIVAKTATKSAIIHQNESTWVVMYNTLMEARKPRMIIDAEAASKKCARYAARNK